MKSTGLKRCALLLALLALRPAIAGAGISGGSTALPFFTEAFDPARAAQGGTFVSASRDAAALFANPASLAGAHQEGFVAHTELGHGLQLEGAALSLPVGRHAGTLSFGAGFAHIDGLTARDEDGNDLAGGVGYGAVMLRAAYARDLARGFSAGLSAEYLGQRIGDASGTGFAGGAGFRYTSGRTELAASADHIGPSLKSGGTTADPMPMGIRGGVCVHATPGLDLSSEWAHVRGAPQRLAGGIAFRVAGLASLRVGYHKDLGNASAASGFSTGLGAGHGSWNADYGLVQDAGAGIVHRFSLRIAFGRPAPLGPPSPNSPPR